MLGTTGTRSPSSSSHLLFSCSSTRASCALLLFSMNRSCYSCASFSSSMERAFLPCSCSAVVSLHVSLLLASTARLMPFAFVFLCSSFNPVNSVYTCIHCSMPLSLPSAKSAIIFRDPSVSSKCRSLRPQHSPDSTDSCHSSVLAILAPVLTSGQLSPHCAPSRLVSSQLCSSCFCGFLHRASRS